MTAVPYRPLSTVSSVTSREERSRRTAVLMGEAAQTSDACRREDLLAEVVALNLQVAHTVAHRYAGRGIDVEDLEQVAGEALVKAVRRYDPTQCRDLLSYAVPTIRGELQRHFRDHGWMVRPTRRVQETQWRATRAEGELAQELGRNPRPSEVLDVLGLSPEEYAEAKTARGCFHPTSLDQPASDDSTQTLGELLPADDKELAESEARAMVVPLLRALPERERRVVYLRYYEELTQHEIGDAIGVAQSHVSRILDHVLDGLRERLDPAAHDGDGPPPAA